MPPTASDAQAHDPKPPTPSTPATARTEPAPPLLARHANATEAALEHAFDRVWRTFRKRPYVGTALAGGVGLAAASLIGVGELAIAVGAGYAAYQVFKNREPPAQAMREALQLERKLGA